MSALLAAAGGFLLAVLWMDLIFDVQVLGHRRTEGPLPEPVLASIAGYYKRATTDSYPMGRLVAVVMGVAVLGSFVHVFTGTSALALRVAAVSLCVAPTGLALARVVPNAVRLGSRRDDASTQSTLARAVCRDHLVCLVCIAAFVSTELALAAA